MALFDPKAQGHQITPMAGNPLQEHDEYSELSTVRMNQAQPKNQYMYTIPPAFSGKTVSISYRDPHISDNDYVEPTMDDPHRLTSDEEKHREKAARVCDLDEFPREAATAEEALDLYCEQGYYRKMQFRIFEHQRRHGALVMFSLVCATRGGARYIAHTSNGTYAPQSNCRVNLRFYWNEQRQLFERQEGSWTTIHDHNLSIDDHCLMSPEVINIIKRACMEEPRIRPTKVIERVRERTVVRKDNGEEVCLLLSPLEVLNALKLIRGCKQLNQEEMAADLRTISEAHQDACVTSNMGTPKAIFVQTAEMLAMQKLYGNVVLVNVTKNRKNKYEFFSVMFTGINNLGNIVVFAIAFVDIKCKEGYDWILKNNLKKQALKNDIPDPVLMVCPLETDFIESAKEAYFSLRLIVNQHHYLHHTTDLISRHKRRLDFDHGLCTQKFRDILEETCPEKFEKLKTEILLMIRNLDKTTQNQIETVIETSPMWSLLAYKDTYTAGLHSNERAAEIEQFIKSNHKFDFALSEVVQSLGRLQSKDMCLETNSKEANSYVPHPIFVQLKYKFSPYAMSLMFHQILQSFKYTAFDFQQSSAESDVVMSSQDVERYTVQTDVEGLKYTIEWDIKNRKMSCHCPFYFMNQLICSHCFCVMTALQIKHIDNFRHLGSQWSDEINPEEPNSFGLIEKQHQQKKIRAFVDKVAEKDRQKRAKHKGGFVPSKRKRFNVEFYPSSGSDTEMNDDKGIGVKVSEDGKRQIQMFDLMVPQGACLKAYSRQEEDRRKTAARLKKKGIDLESHLQCRSKKLPSEPLRKPRMEMMSSDSSESDGNLGDEVLYEFKKMTEKDQVLAKARLENQEIEKKLRKENFEEKARQKKKEEKKRKKMKKEARRRREVNEPQGFLANLPQKSFKTRREVTREQEEVKQSDHSVSMEEDVIDFNN